MTAFSKKGNSEDVFLSNNGLRENETNKASYCIIVLKDAQTLSETMYILLFLF